MGSNSALRGSNESGAIQYFGFQQIKRGRSITMSLITVLNPEYEEDKQHRVSMATRGELIEPVTIAVIDNSKPHAKELLTYVAEGLRDYLSVEEIIVHSKSSAGKPIDADEAEMLAARAHLIISGLGD
jgi:hypothetical protein